MKAVHQLTQLIGREREITWLRERIDGGERLVTLFGPPGVGKTRIALEALEAEQAEGRAAFFCDLSSARSDEELSEVLLSVLTDREGTAQGDLRSAVRAALEARDPALIVLDNFEQLAAVAGLTVAEWAAESKRSTFVVTSREILGVPGEMAREVLPLALPSDASEVDEAPSARMLLEAIGRYQPDLDRRGLDRERLLDVLTRLEGIPLAIEIVAPRIALLGLPLVQEQLLSVLASETHARRGPLRTLNEAIGWSWDLLNESEKCALAQVTIFRGGFTVEGMTQVIEVPSDDTALGLLLALRNKSLVRQLPGETSGAPRFALYASLAHFASQRLEDFGPRATLEERHRRYFTSLARRALDGDAAASKMLDDETENVVAALERGLGLTADDALEQNRTLLLTLPRLSRLSVSHRLSLFDAAFKTAPLQDDLVSAHLLLARADVLSYAARGRDAVRELDLERGLTLAQVHNVQSLEARFLVRLGCALLDAEPTRAMAPLGEAARIARTVGDRPTEAAALGALVFARLSDGDDDSALELSARELNVADSAVSLKHQVNARLHAAAVHIARRDAPTALAHLRWALEKANRVRPSLEAFTLWHLGMAHHVDGSFDEAETAYRGAITRHHDHIRPYYAAVVRTTLALLLIECGRPREALTELDRLEPEFAHYRAAAAIAPPLRVIAAALLEGRPADLGQFIHSAGELEPLMALVASIAPPHTPPVKTARRIHAIESAILTSAIARQKTPRTPSANVKPDGARVLVHVRGGWFRVPGGPIVDCQGRQAIRELLLGLAERRVQTPGASVSIEELQQMGWPDERISAESARARIRQSISLLRKMGLGKFIVWRGNGYMISERIEVEFRS